MEYFWYIIAALGAGIGTGLAGLSAATVMVPILIVLCPSFSGEQGAYQATAIALASDILGSAVTTSVYIKHKNIDLRHGWIMLICILSMCTVGSYVAWKAGNVVLGTFSLFLTFGIGIRFLVKPDTQKEDTISRDSKLGMKGVIISLFFGLTIGFGTGFVGTGGGMMMLVVFTAFLGMELKTAVGTSTFIMTFTALIASVSHILIEPSIILERWDALIICIVTATVSSLVSAKFANRFNNRIVGLVTGGVLTVLGASMLLLNYRQLIRSWSLLWAVLDTFRWYLLYVLIAAAALIILNYTCKVPRELFRKLLHGIAFTSAIVIMYLSGDWAVTVIILVVFAIVVYPVLALLEHWPGFDALFVQRRTGEIKKSLLLLFLTHAVLVAFCWGLMDLPYIAVAAILMWGTGDAAAALVGKRFGKHHVHLPHADPKKTWEGTLGMMVTAFVIGTVSLLLTTTFPWYRCVLTALVVSPVAAYTELVSHNGNDTVSVPVANTIVLMAIHFLLA